jgi:hypothetical protein
MGTRTHSLSTRLPSTMHDRELAEGQQYAVEPSASSISVNCRITAWPGKWVTASKVTAHGARRQGTAPLRSGQRRTIVAYIYICIYIIYMYYYIYKVKKSHYRPWQAMKLPRGWVSQILRQSAHEGGKVVSPTHRPPLPSRNNPVLRSVRCWVHPRAIVRPKDFLYKKSQWQPPESNSRPSDL